MIRYYKLSHTNLMLSLMPEKVNLYHSLGSSWIMQWLR